MFERQTKTAQKLISKYGQDVTFVHILDEKQNDRPWLTQVRDEAELTVKMVFLPLNRSGLETLTLMNKSEVAQKALLAYMPKQNFEPSLNDYVIRDGERLEILSIDEINPNGESVYFKLILKS